MFRASYLWGYVQNQFSNPGLLRDTTFVALAGIFSGVGSLVYWKLITFRFSVVILGLASTVISSAVFLGMLATLGIVIGFGRFLSGQTPGAKLTLIRLSYILCLATGVLIGTIFLLGKAWWAPTLFPAGNSWGFSSFFLLLLLSFCMVSLNGGVIQAEKQMHFLLLQSLVINIIQITGGWFVPVEWGEMGVIFTYVLPILVVAICGFFLVPYLAHIQNAKFDFYAVPVSSILQYSVANQVFSLIWQFPSFIFPLIILHLLGAEKNGLLAIAWYGCAFVAVIPNSAMSVLLVYGSNDLKNLGRHLYFAMAVGLTLLTPVVLVILVFAPWLLSFFGQQYESATLLLRLLILGSIPLTVNGLYLTLKRIHKQIALLNLLASIQTAVIVGLCYFLVISWGLDGLGLGWLIGQTLCMFLVLLFLWAERDLRHSELSRGAVNVNTIRFSISNLLGSSYLFFPFLKRWPPVRHLIVTQDTGICIEAPPRSANSYAVNVFSMWNPKISVAHHIHVPMQVIYAAKWQIPCLVLLRDPIEVLSSLLIVDLKLSMTVAIMSYVNFYQQIRDVQDQIVVANFQEVITNYQAVIERVNTKYGTSFEYASLSQEQTKKIFDQMERNTLAQGQPALLVPIPKDYKEQLKVDVKEQLKVHPLFADAKKVYAEWSSRFSV